MDDIRIVKYLGYKVFYRYYLGSDLVQQLRVVRTSFGIQLVVIPYSVIGRTLLRHGIWEGSTTMFLLKQLKPGNVFVDVGANIGYYTCLAASKVGSEGVVVAFEPEPITYKILKLNVNLNRLSNVLCEPYAVDLRDDTSLLYINPAETGGHSLIPKVSGMRAVVVNTISLGSYFSRQKLPLPDFVKIDVEGAELRVLLGMGKILEKVVNTKIIIELTFKEYSIKQLLLLLRMYNLRPHIILSDGNVKPIKYEALRDLRGNNILLTKER